MKTLPISSSVKFPCYQGRFIAKKGLTTTGFLHPSQYLERFNLLSAGFSNGEKRLLEQAFSLAWQAHGNIVRFNLIDPYIVHLLGAAENLKKYGLGSVEISACLLHDIIEDGTINGAKITDVFLKTALALAGFPSEVIDRIYLIINGVTELGKEPGYAGAKPSPLEVHKKFLEYGSRDLAIIIIKILGDRLDNMRTLDYMSSEKQKAKARETLHLYVPLADALGVWDLKRELEDLSFKYLEPPIYNRILAKRKKIIERTEKALDDKLKIIIGSLEQLGIPIRINKETRGVYEIYERTQRRESITLENLSFSDIWRIGIVVPTGEDLFRVVGRIHGLEFAPVDGEFRDFVNNPCPNGHKFIQTYLTTFLGNLLTQLRLKSL